MKQTQTKNCHSSVAYKAQGIHLHSPLLPRSSRHPLISKLTFSNDNAHLLNDNIMSAPSPPRRGCVLVPIISTVKKIVEKDILTSKKYNLGHTLLILALSGWSSIPDSVRLVRNVKSFWKQALYSKLITRFIVDFLLMAFKFFARKQMILGAVSITM